MKKYSFIILVLSFFTNALPAQTIITSIAGTGTSGYSGDGGAATVAELKAVAAVAVDSSGNIFISHQIGLIRKINTSGIISTFAGNGTSGYSGDGGPATLAEINGNTGFITFDKKGNTFFSDAGRVRKVDASGIITTVAGNGLSPAYGNGGPATAAALVGSTGICTDNVGNIYVNAQYQVRKIDTAGIITAYAGTGISGFGGMGGPATAAQIGGAGQIAMDEQGNLYIADRLYNCVYKVTTAGIMTLVAGTGSGVGGYSGDGGPATAAQLNSPGVFPDRCGNLYIGDAYNNRVRMVNAAGYIYTIAGTGVQGYGGDGGNPMGAKFFYPRTVCLDKHGNIYIGDQTNYRVRYIHMDSCRNTLDAPLLQTTEAAGALSVFPNPTTGTFTLQLNTTATEPVTITITNLLGAHISTYQTLSNTTKDLNLDLPPGIYILTATTDGERYNTKLVIR